LKFILLNFVTGGQVEVHAAHNNNSDSRQASQLIFGGLFKNESKPNQNLAGFNWV
jgi:hypothetical protein